MHMGSDYNVFIVQERQILSADHYFVAASSTCMVIMNYTFLYTLIIDF